MEFLRLLGLHLSLLLKSERGQTMSEYAILIAWIALLVIVGATKFGTTVSGIFHSQAGRL
jgi:Flp pilus assembly pilin Flp